MATASTSSQQTGQADAALANSHAAETPYQSLPFKKSSGVSTDSLASVYMTTMILLLVGIVLLWLLRRRLQKKGSLPSTLGANIQYLDRCRLNAKTQVYLVRVDQQGYLVADNGQTIALEKVASLKPSVGDQI